MRPIGEIQDYSLVGLEGKDALGITLPHNILLYVPANAIKQEKKKKGLKFQTRKSISICRQS